MERIDQYRIVNQLLNSVGDEVRRNIADRKVPKDWDGHELREYMYVLLSRERSPIMRNGRSARTKSFKNTLAITPL